MIKNFFVGLLLILGISSYAQKRALTPDDFDSWKSIGGVKMSENGRYAVYQYDPAMGDGVLIIKDLKTSFQDTIPRGTNANFSANSNFVTFDIEVPLEIRRREETKKTSGKKKEKDSLGIYVLSSHKLKKYPKNYGYSMPEEGAEWLAFKTIVSTPEEQVKDTLVKDTVAATDKGDKKEKKPKMKLDTLVVVMNPLSGDSISFDKIKQYTWAKKSDKLLLTTEKKDSVGTRSAMIWFDAGTKKHDTIYNEEGWLKGVSFEDNGNYFAFLKTTDTTKIKKYELFLGNPSGAVKGVADTRIDGLPTGWTVSENSRLYFSENGKRLFFGTSELETEHEKDTLLNNERERLDIWSWTDLELQPMQKLNLSRDKRKTYLAVLNIPQMQAIQLSDTLVPDVSVLEKGDMTYALGSDDTPYKRAQSWNGLWIRDFYLIDMNSGERRLLKQGQGSINVGPAQKYAVYYNREDSIYYSLDLATRKELPLTKNLPVKFYDELNDTPSEPYAYGVTGWAENDRYIFIYDRYDIWKLDPTMKEKPVRVTADGRENHMEYRYQQLDRDEKFIDMNGKVLVRMFNEDTKQAGIAYANFKRSRHPQTIMKGDYSLRLAAKADNSDALLYTKESFKEYPELYATDSRFKAPVKISNGGSQMAAYKWGNVKLVSWTSYDGVPLQGILYMPENMEIGKRYPMVSYFYERSSDNLNRFVTPAPSRSTVNKTFYVSNDYLIFVPDIVYKDGYPGKSAYNCIVSGVEAMVDQFPFVDTERVALQGQSWGGYQTAFLITQTDRFAAAMAGAPVSNMTSAYGGIRWGTGMSRMFQYEHTQSRIGGTLWEKPELYIENSPLFYADKINTPLLMMHNDEDGAVPWYQGIEYFVALRRLNKPVWMLSYNGEPHNLEGRSWGNRKDLSIRMMQFFDHYLKDKPEPKWMKKGRPALTKDYDKAY
ncbi:alpha/beta hydrolase family protein [Robertkochia solimangrovi]|uniref:alpha/beta hydrolase family protein n=1 Tax=Robertkochia solimangrovi TaxID=2213046 RepID=UPI00117E34E5|nr:prolyl oligopeptidase family serine peptidase [Robertkochia solimangrovi]TRZ45154.1 S9 family peptidase [Robertkochia solimangrovi]